MCGNKFNSLLTIGMEISDYKSGRITVPKYQRGAVWNKKQKEKLIQNLQKYRESKKK